MKLKSILLAGVLGLLTLSLGIAKTYDISFAQPTKAGSVELKPGAYKLTVDGTKATFTAVKGAQAFTTDVKVQSVPKSFESTKVESSVTDGTTVVKDIEVGGSKIKLDF